MEKQLYDYIDNTFLPEGLEHRFKLYNTIVFGIKIRTWIVKINRNYIDLIPYWNSTLPTDIENYKDTGIANDTTKIYNFLEKAKAVVRTALAGPSATSAIAQASYTPIATSLTQGAPTLTAGFARLTSVAPFSATQPSTSANSTRTWYYTDATKTYSLYSNSTLVSNTPYCPRNEWVYCDSG
ncbi:hypothetical protein OCU04_012350 [Sclerotinia nivalis]|uniref:Uncharacterized protein n=1 Tax=Sclerotinia nivalis TaxID=352851 RepID=A0A9X0DG21_9HELO|nr:hypothetical protein OCU04_012350 [Sclerotinia nivalis]